MRVITLYWYRCVLTIATYFIIDLLMLFALYLIILFYWKHNITLIENYGNLLNIL